MGSWLPFQVLYLDFQLILGCWDALGRMEDAAVSLTREASRESGQHSSGYSDVP